MKTPEKIKEALQRHKDADCGHCPYYFLNPCAPDLIDDTLALIEQLEKKVEDAEAAIQEKDRIIDLMKEQMRGVCSLCRYSGVNCEDEPCFSCILSNNNQAFEYVGLPGA